MADSELFLGTSLSAADRVTLDADHLTTHAVCLGMTGSGKTGLGVVVLEELARRGTPLLVIDLKGDMIDLLLTFPALDGPSFAPWLPPEDAAGDRAAAATAVAQRWREGLAGAGLDGDDVAAVRGGVRWQLLTPGVASAAPLDILPSLAPPPAGLGDDDVRARADGVVAALLSLVGRGGDPLTDRDHVLLASLVLHHWSRGEALDLAGIVRTIATPPIADLGALPLETFYPRDDRMKLVLALNTLLASPAFRAWTLGTPLTMEALLGSAGEPRATILTVAHLDQRQRLFVLSLLLAELLAWTRRQPASSGLRALLYLDEVQGILPPHPANPPTKAPLLTLLKQGRAFGVGVWLATQNPVDLDYKAAGNAGVQVIGRLITEHDRARALDGLGLRTLPDGRDADDVVAGLGKRQFVLVDVRAGERVRTFASRWAMSYLRGPVTLAELGPLVAAPVAAAAPTSPSTAAAGQPQPPVMTTAATVAFERDAAGLLTPWLAIESRLRVERASLDLARDLAEQWWIPLDASGAADWEAAAATATPPALVDTPPAAARFPTAAPAGLGTTLDNAARDFAAWRAGRPVEVLAHARLKLAAAPEESAEAFRLRCLEAADHADDARQEAVRARFEKRIDTVKRRLERERDELDRDREQLASRQTEEKLGMVEGLFSVLLGSRSLRSAAGKAASKARTAATKRRMRQRAEGSVVESENEIERLTAELEELGVEMQDEVDRIAAESEALAEQVATVAIRPTRTQIEVLKLRLVWR